MRIKNRKDFWAGMMFIAFGAIFAGYGMRYPIGTAAKMGPGYFPLALSVIVILLGTFISLGSLSVKTTEEKVDKFDWPVMFVVTASVVLFSYLLKPLGLITSLFILIALSSYASHEFSLKSTLINAAILIGICLLVFIWALKLPFTLWPSFIGN
jgi:hypothetical protein